MELTQEHFDNQLKPITAELAAIKTQMATSEDLRATERRLIEHTADLQAELARMVEGGFTDIQDRLEVRDRLERMEKYEPIIKQLASKAGLKLDW